MGMRATITLENTSQEEFLFIRYNVIYWNSPQIIVDKPLSKNITEIMIKVAMKSSFSQTLVMVCCYFFQWIIIEFFLEKICEPLHQSRTTDGDYSTACMPCVFVNIHGHDQITFALNTPYNCCKFPHIIKLFHIDCFQR